MRGSAVARDLGVIPSRGHGDAPLDAFAKARAARWRCQRWNERLERDHAAADIHAHGRRNHGALGGDHRAHRGALAVVAIGHDRDPLEEEGKLGGVQDLLLRFRLDLRPGQKRIHLFADPSHAGGFSPSLSQILATESLRQHQIRNPPLIWRFGPQDAIFLHLFRVAFCAWPYFGVALFWGGGIG